MDVKLRCFGSKYDNRHQNTDDAVVGNLISKVVEMFIFLDHQQMKTENESDECTYFVFIFYFKVLCFT